MTDVSGSTQSTTTDFTASVLALFCQLTGRISTSCADYATAESWAASGMPFSIAQRGLEQKLGRAVGKSYLRTMPLSWCEGDVFEQFDNWRRAVGPHAVRSLPIRSDRLAV